MAAREKILIIRLKSIGDILFTLPAVHAIRQNFPDAELHFLVSQEHAPLLRGFAEIDRVVPLDRRMYRSINFISAITGTLGLVRQLRHENYSRVIDLQSFGETELLAWLSGAPERWGHIYQSGRGWAYTRGISTDAGIAPAQEHLQVLQKCGLQTNQVRNEFVLTAAMLAAAKTFFTQNNLDPARPALFFQPFTSSPHKNWPLQNYATVARHFQTNGAQIIFGGGTADRSRLESLRSEGFAMACGEPLLVAAALIKLSTLAVGGDTGILHLAVALSRRVVMLMPHPFSKTIPFWHPDWAISPPPGKNISHITTGEVIAACEHALG